MLIPIPFGNPYTYAGHSGVDFPQMRGTPFRASATGVVSSIDYSPRAGHTVWVRYDNGPNVGYCHMDYRTSNVRVGQRVSEGTILGLVGSLGLASTGPHLHVEVAGHATTAGFWKFFDRNRVVGQGSSAGEEEKGPFMSLSSAEQREMLNLLRDVQNRIRGPIEQPYDMLQGISGSTNNIQRIQGGNLSSENQVALFQNVEVVRRLAEAFEPVAITDAQIKAIAGAVAAQVGKSDVAINYDRIADAVREKFSSSPLK
jgi:murein DD-endopeptidase MepM/ murein hydrolase activator NlpD